MLNMQEFYIEPFIITVASLKCPSRALVGKHGDLWYMVARSKMYKMCTYYTGCFGNNIQSG